MKYPIKNLIWIFSIWLSFPFAIQAQDQPVKYRLENPVSVLYFYLVFVKNSTKVDFTSANKKNCRNKFKMAETHNPGVIAGGDKTQVKVRPSVI